MVNVLRACALGCVRCMTRVQVSLLYPLLQPDRATITYCLIDLNYVAPPSLYPYAGLLLRFPSVVRQGGACWTHGVHHAEPQSCWLSLPNSVCRSPSLTPPAVRQGSACWMHGVHQHQHTNRSPCHASASPSTSPCAGVPLTLSCSQTGRPSYGVWLTSIMPPLLPCTPMQVSFFDPLLQSDREVRAGRMECTMQNLADSLTVRTPQRLEAAAPAAAAAAAAAGNGDAACEELSTFMVYNLRRKVGWGLSVMRFFQNPGEQPALKLCATYIMFIGSSRGQQHGCW